MVSGGGQNRAYSEGVCTGLEFRLSLGNEAAVRLRDLTSIHSCEIRFERVSRRANDQPSSK